MELTLTLRNSRARAAVYFPVWIMKAQLGFLSLLASLTRSGGVLVARPSHLRGRKMANLGNVR